MPREVTAYLCEHRCGRRACCDRKAVERHEATCFMNPARRSCKTCEWEYEEDGSRDCDSPVNDGQYDPLDYFDINRWSDGTSRIAVNCYHWEPHPVRFPDGVEVPLWEPLPKPEKHETADF